jgi:hypothetical protein
MWDIYLTVDLVQQVITSSPELFGQDQSHAKECLLVE